MGFRRPAERTLIVAELNDRYRCRLWPHAVTTIGVPLPVRDRYLANRGSRRGICVKKSPMDHHSRYNHGRQSGSQCRNIRRSFQSTSHSTAFPVASITHAFQGCQTKGGGPSGPREPSRCRKSSASRVAALTGIRVPARSGDLPPPKDQFPGGGGPEPPWHTTRWLPPAHSSYPQSAPHFISTHPLPSQLLLQ